MKSVHMQCIHHFFLCRCNTILFGRVAEVIELHRILHALARLEVNESTCLTTIVYIFSLLVRFNMARVRYTHRGDGRTDKIFRVDSLLLVALIFILHTSI